MAAAACAYVEVGKRSGFAMMGFVMRIWLLLLLWNPDMILTFWFCSLTRILEKIPLSFTSIGIWGIHHCGDHVGYRRTLKVQITKVEKAWPQKMELKWPPCLSQHCKIWNVRTILHLQAPMAQAPLRAVPSASPAPRSPNTSFVWYPTSQKLHQNLPKQTTQALLPALLKVLLGRFVLL